MQTPRKHPRTLQEAFGPYASGPIHPMHEPRGYGWAWWAAMAVIFFVTLTLIGATL